MRRPSASSSALLLSFISLFTITVCFCTRTLFLLPLVTFPCCLDSFELALIPPPSLFPIYTQSQPQHAFRILSPPSIAGFYSHCSAGFGPVLGSLDLTLSTVISSPIDACSPLTPPAGNATFFVGKSVLVLRGSCSFIQKAVNVQNAGALMMMLGNNDPTTGTFPMLRSPDDQTVMTVAAFMISFNDYVRIGALASLASSSTGSAPVSLTAARGFDALAAAVVQHSALASSTSSVNLVSVRAALAELRRTAYAVPRESNELEGSSSGTSTGAAPVIVRATSVGENFDAWQNYWDGIPVGDWGLGTRSWLFWLFPISVFLVLQMYCFLRCQRSVWWRQLSARMGLAGDDAAVAGAAPVGAVGAGARNINGNGDNDDDDPEFRAAMAQIAAEEARIAAAAAQAPGYGSVNQASSSSSSAAYVHMPADDADERPADESAPSGRPSSIGRRANHEQDDARARLL